MVMILAKCSLLHLHRFQETPMVKLGQEIDEFARESEYCDFHVKRVLTGYGGSVEKDAAALDEEKGKIILEETRNLHQFNDSIDNFVMRAVPSENDST